jgi:hypothetical protein
MIPDFVQHCEKTSDRVSLPSDRSKNDPYEPALADSEREAVADLLQFLENASTLHAPLGHR